MNPASQIIPDQRNPGFDVKKMIEITQRTLPEVWRIAYPRMYRNIEAYCSPKIPAAVICAAIEYSTIRGGFEKSRPMEIVYVAADKILDYDVPTLFVAPELLDAAIRTNPPPDVKWSELRMPFEAGIFMLPKNAMVDSNGLSYDFIGYARRRVGERTKTRFTNISLELPWDGFIIFTTATNGRGFILEYAIDNTTPFIIEEDIEPLIPRTPFEVTLEGDESKMMAKLMNLVFRVFLAIDARPKLLSYGKKSGNHRKNSNLEIWTPNIIGKDYAAKRVEPKGGTHSSPRMHWRRGHYRSQAYGVGRIEHRTIWLEPVLVGVGENDSSEELTTI